MYTGESFGRTLRDRDDVLRAFVLVVTIVAAAATTEVCGRIRRGCRFPAMDGAIEVVHIFAYFDTLAKEIDARRGSDGMI